MSPNRLRISASVQSPLRNRIRLGSLARAIARLLADPDLARRLGEAARWRAREHYGREAMVRRFEDFYAGLMTTAA